MNDKNQNKSNKVFLALACLFALIFLGCVMWIIFYFVGLNRAEQEMDLIKNEYVQEGGSETASSESTEAVSSESESVEESIAESTEEITESTEESIAKVDTEDYPSAEKVIDFEALKSQVNADIYAWITVPGTVIDYPVLQHPTEMDYYLEYNLDGSKGYPGCIYTQRMNSKDWTDYNTVLYGHNMKNGTMFAGLHRFKDQTFFDANQYIYVYTEDYRVLIYRIFGAYEYSDLHILMGNNFNTELGRQTYIDTIFGLEGMNNHFNTDVEVTPESKIITLSTCISNKPSQRYLVQGVLIAEGTQDHE